MNMKKIGLVALGVLLGLVVVVANLRLPTPGGAVQNAKEAVAKERSTAATSARAPVPHAPIVEESADLVSAEEQVYLQKRNSLLKIREEHSSLVIGTIGGSHPSAHVSKEEMDQRIGLIKQDPDAYLESWSHAQRERREQRELWVIEAEKASQDLAALDTDGTNRFGAERIASLLAGER